jgi:hypothetical protein
MSLLSLCDVLLWNPDALLGEFVACLRSPSLAQASLRKAAMHFLLNLIQPHAVAMFVLALICLVGYGYPGYVNRDAAGVAWLLWLIGGILAVVAWVLLVFR